MHASIHHHPSPSITIINAFDARLSCKSIVSSRVRDRHLRACGLTSRTDSGSTPCFEVCGWDTGGRGTEELKGGGRAGQNRQRVHAGAAWLHGLRLSSSI